MKKLVFLVFSVLIMFCATACTMDKASILFNHDPITKETVMNNTTVFDKGERIYYLILTPKTVHSRYIYIQIIKKDNDYNQFGYQLYWGNTVRVKDEQMYYYDDYIVINEKGNYIMKVYSKDKPQVPLTQAQFFVR